MSNDFSLIGIESVPVAEYLPILEKIKHDLQCIHDKFETENRFSQNFNLVSIASHNIPTEETTKKIYQTESDGRTLYPESEQQVKDKLKSIVQYISKNNANENGDQVLSLLETVETYVKAKTAIPEEDNIPSNESENTELRSLRKSHRECSSTIKELKETLEHIRGKNVPSPMDYIGYQRLMEETIEKGAIIEGSKEDIANKKREIEEKDIKIRMLEEKLERLQNERTSFTDKRKISGDMKSTDQTVDISGLESKNEKLEMQNEENQRIISQLENKIKFLENRDEDDERYVTIISNIRTKVREKDVIIEKIESENADFESKVRKLEREIRSQKILLSDAKNELADAEKLRDDFETKYKNLLKKNKELEMKVSESESNEKYLDEMKSLKAALKKEEMASRNKDNTIEELQRENENSKLLTMKCKELEANLQKVKLEDQEKYDELVRRNDEEMKKKNDAIQTMRTKMKAKNEEKPDPIEIKRLNTEIRMKTNEIEHLNEKYINMNEAYEKICNENDFSKKEINNLKSELDNMKRLHVARGGVSDNRRENTNVKKQESNQFPDWWKTHMSS